MSNASSLYILSRTVSITIQTFIYFLLFVFNSVLFAQSQYPLHLENSFLELCSDASLEDSHNEKDVCSQTPFSTSENVIDLSQEEQVKMLLMGREWTLDKEAFLQLGSGVDQILINIITNPAPVPNFYRVRALEALHLYPNERVGNFLEVYIYENRHAVLVTLAFKILVKGFSLTDQPRVRRTALIMVRHPEPAIQEIASAALGKNAVFIKKK